MRLRFGVTAKTRSYMYIDDCVEGLIRLMASDCPDALNLGTDRMVTIDELFFMIGKIAGKKLRTRHNLSKPQGVRGRNSDNTRLLRELGWEPSMELEEGLRITYRWIENEVRRAGRVPVLNTQHAGR